MDSLVTHLVGAALPVVTLVIALEALGAPLPGETLMIALGTSLAARHESLVPVFFALWVGAVAGDNIGYLIGRRFGRNAVLHHGTRFGLTEARLQRAEAAFARYGVALVLVARFFVLLRQLNGVLAGTLALPWWRFVLANTLGGALWVGLWLAFSHAVSAELLGHLQWLHRFKAIVAIGVVLVAGGLVLRSLRKDADT
ncbi:DedA family protein [Nitrogeniibacter mangrovi]|uniref:DedA family protein n=1 Tax=Nitrogeniibacter mangrovi TaxID=2016596 RepID=A0A6C1AYH2_9RHOO|nr:DedA family protein [Nitrogeniibacter mangrovi]QID16411.1 DedA family protein [Nitrogeniibacter mangrovi]